MIKRYEKTSRDTQRSYLTPVPQSSGVASRTAKATSVEKNPSSERPAAYTTTSLGTRHVSHTPQPKGLHTDTNLLEPPTVGQGRSKHDRGDAEDAHNGNDDGRLGQRACTLQCTCVLCYTSRAVRTWSHHATCNLSVWGLVSSTVKK